MAISDTLQRPVGPLPMWGWGAIAIGGFVVFRFLRGSGGGGTSGTVSVPSSDSAGGGGIPLLPDIGGTPTTPTGFPLDPYGILATPSVPITPSPMPSTTATPSPIKGITRVTTTAPTVVAKLATAPVAPKTTATAKAIISQPTTVVRTTTQPVTAVSNPFSAPRTEGTAVRTQPLTFAPVPLLPGDQPGEGRNALATKPLTKAIPLLPGDQPGEGRNAFATALPVSIPSTGTRLGGVSTSGYMTPNTKSVVYSSPKSEGTAVRATPLTSTVRNAAPRSGEGSAITATPLKTAVKAVSPKYGEGSAVTAKPLTTSKTTSTTKTSKPPSSKPPKPPKRPNEGGPASRGK